MYLLTCKSKKAVTVHVLVFALHIFQLRYCYIIILLHNVIGKCSYMYIH